MRSYAVERDNRQWPDLHVYSTKLRDLPSDSKRALFYRERNSHRGISSFSRLRELRARQVNQEFLDEIGALADLEYLDLQTVTAHDLSPLRQLRTLKSLHLSSVRHARDFDPLLASPNLEWLFIAHVKHLEDLTFLQGAHGLWSLGVEGSLHVPQTIDTLAPIAGLRKLENLFMTSTRLMDKDLTALTKVPNLKVLNCARFAPKGQFDLLRRAMPHLECRWCDQYETDH